ncbi:MAG: effector-associated domain EAD1-containing protein [Xenococcaceae cyanobacterium]
MSKMPSIFICYSHQDQEWFDRLSQYLKTFDILGKAESWSDRKIEIGNVWDKEIKDNLKRAGAAILLVSQSFLISDYIRDVEVPAILTKHDREPNFVILPIILDLSLFEETTFKYPHPQTGPKEISLSIFQTANPPSHPLDSLPKPEQDRIFVSVAKRLFDILESYQQGAEVTARQETTAQEVAPTISDPLQLTGAQRKQFREALISAFPSKGELQIMLSEELDIDLDAIARGDNYQQIVFNLIKYIEAQGKVKDFLEAAHGSNSSNHKLNQFYLLLMS